MKFTYQGTCGGVSASCQKFYQKLVSEYKLKYERAVNATAFLFVFYSVKTEKPRPARER